MSQSLTITSNAAFWQRGYISGANRLDGPLFNLRKTYVDALQDMLDEGIPDSGQLASWLPMMQS